MSDKTNQKGEISLKDFILLIAEYFREVVRKWWIIALFLIPILGMFIRKTYTTPGTYPTKIKFLVESEEGSGGGGISGILGSLGLSSGGGKFNPYKVLEVALSKRMAGNILMGKSKCSEKSIANVIIDKYQLVNIWAEGNPSYKDFQFKSNTVEEFSDLERKVFNKLLPILFGTEIDRTEALVGISFDEKSGIFKFTSKTEAECLTLSIINTAYDNLRNFFEDDIMQNKIQSLQVLKMKKDSIENLIDVNGLAYARLEDSSRGLIFKESQYKKNKLLVEIQGLKDVFTQLSVNYELTDIAFRDSQPMFMVIDKPFPPLGRAGESLILNVILGTLLGLFLGIGFIVARKFILDIMKDTF